MGHIIHHAIIVTSINEIDTTLAHKKAKELFGEQVTETVTSPKNFYKTFFIGPDGSKEQWQPSEEGDRLRFIFKEWVRNFNKIGAGYICAAETQYYDEEGNTWIKTID